MAGYEVTDTREISEMTPGGGRRTLYRVWLRTLRGATGTVDVPAGDWQKDKLPAILQTKADQLDLAYNL
jgi:hypothetical protein